MTKTYFIFRLDWSQTDHDMVIVHASSRAEAEAYLNRETGGKPRYISFYAEVDTIIKV